MNVIARLAFELGYFEAAVQLFSRYSNRKKLTTEKKYIKAVINGTSTNFKRKKNPTILGLISDFGRKIYIEIKSGVLSG